MASLREKGRMPGYPGRGGSSAGQWYMEESQVPKPCSRKPALGGLPHQDGGPLKLSQAASIFPWDVPGGSWWIYF